MGISGQKGEPGFPGSVGEKGEPGDEGENIWLLMQGYTYMGTFMKLG